MENHSYHHYGHILGCSVLTKIWFRRTAEKLAYQVFSSLRFLGHEISGYQFESRCYGVGLAKIWIFGQNFDFWPKLRFLAQFYFYLNSDFWPKFWFFPKFWFLANISISGQNFDGLPKYDVLVQTLDYKFRSEIQFKLGIFKLLFYI